MINAGVEVNQMFPGGGSFSTMRGAFLFACQSSSISTITTLLNAGAPRDKFGSYSSNYAKRFALGILLDSGHSFMHRVSCDNLHPIHIAVINNNIEMLEKLLQPNIHELLTDAWFSPLHLACLLN